MKSSKSRRRRVARTNQSKQVIGGLEISMRRMVAETLEEKLPLSADWSLQIASQLTNEDLNDPMQAITSSGIAQEQLDLIAQAAIERWTGTSLDVDLLQQLDQVEFHLADLPGQALGMADGLNVY
jgi:hypothetical protein